MNPKITLLLDGDVYAFRAAAATEHNVTFDGITYTRTGSLPEAIDVFETTLASLMARLEATACIVALTDGENFRKTLYPPYKAHRNPANKPVTLEALRDHITATHKTYQRPGLEGDDVLGILATSSRILPNTRRIIASVDKDMRTIPAEFWDSKAGKHHRTTEQEADYFHMFQTLTGDVADGYPGCPGIGPVNAARVLEEGSCYSEWWPQVVEAFTKKGLTEEDALTQARVARILRVQDYDFTSKEVKVWKPPVKTIPANPVTTSSRPKP